MDLISPCHGLAIYYGGNHVRVSTSDSGITRFQVRPEAFFKQATSYIDRSGLTPRRFAATAKNVAVPSLVARVRP